LPHRQEGRLPRQMPARQYFAHGEILKFARNLLKTAESMCLSKNNFGSLCRSPDHTGDFLR